MINISAIENQQNTLVDQVEERLLDYIRAQNLVSGSTIPSEQVLAEALGVARSVLREALSRLRMIGLIETRTRKGMILREPSLFEGLKRAVNPHILSETSMFDLLGFRIALEEGISEDIFHNITAEHIAELERIVRMDVMIGDNEYALTSETRFHSKLYQITGNRMVAQFQTLIHPIIQFIKSRFSDLFKPINMQLEREGLIVTHTDLFNHIIKGDLEGYKKAINNHFLVYRIFLQGQADRRIADPNSNSTSTSNEVTIS